MRFSLIALLGMVNSAPAVDYLKEVKPLFAARCYACHGAIQQKANLRLDTVTQMLKGEVIKPGKSAESLLIQHVTAEAGFSKMPPAAEGESLTSGQIQLLRDWIDGGAIAPPQELPDPDPREHWAFRAPQRPATIQKAANPVDAFLAKNREGMTTAKPAEPLVLLRRVYLDLTGLPPATDIQDRFLANPSQEHYSGIVDNLLRSPQYGERWGRHFLDIWRYSDWWGLGAELRNSQRHIWHLRDYVVENFNADTPYFQMLREMLAADELYPNDLNKLRATGYLARPYFLFNRTTWLDEVLEHTGKGMLGLTLNCAKCHDHKYDPISMQDYYKLRAIFEPYQVRTDLVPGELDPVKNGIPRAFDCNLEVPTYKHERGDERRPLKEKPIPPGLPALFTFEPVKISPVALPLESYAPHLRSHMLTSSMQQADEKLKRANEILSAAVTKTGESEQLKANRITAARAARKVAESEHDAIPKRFAAERARYTKTPDFNKLAGAAASAEKQLALSKAEEEFAKLEVELLTAKPDQVPVIEKKRPAILKQIEKAKADLQKPGEAYTIPRGAVKSAESNIESAESRNKPFPSTSSGRRTAFANWVADARNPLTARVLVNHVWLRHFGQPLVPTLFDFGRKGTAPMQRELLDWLAVEFTENRTSLKHLHKLIVTSQAYQLSSSSLGLEANVAKDPENKRYWRQNSSRMEAQVVRDSLLSLAGKLDLKQGGPPVPTTEQAESLRRSIYFFHSHNEHNKFLGQFDDANVLDCYRRTDSIVPQQALTLFNSKFALTMAEATTQKLEQDFPKVTDEEFIRLGFRYLLGNQPSSAEVEACQEAIADWRATLKPVEADRKARINLIGALLNHNDFLTIR